MAETNIKNGNGSGVKLNSKDFSSGQDVRWCPGCGGCVSGSCCSRWQRGMSGLSRHVRPAR